MKRRPPRSPLFPYTTLSRSAPRRAVAEHGADREPAPAPERDVAAEPGNAAPPGRGLPDGGARPDAPPAALGARAPAADEEARDGEAAAPAERGAVDARHRPPEHDVARADQMREGLARAGEDRGARADEGRPAAVVERDLGEARERQAERRAVPDRHQHARRRLRRPRRQHQAEEDPCCTAHGARARRKPDATRAAHRPPRQVPCRCSPAAIVQRPNGPPSYVPECRISSGRRSNAGPRSTQRSRPPRPRRTTATWPSSARRESAFPKVIIELPSGF